MGKRKGDWKLGCFWVLGMLFLMWFFLKDVHAESTYLRASPKVSMVGNPVSLYLHLSAEDSCKGRRWYFGETESYHESDCDPNEEPQVDSETRRVRYPPGDWTVCVGLEQPQGKTRKKVCDDFHVGGGQ